MRSLLTYAPLPEWRQVFNSLINLNNDSNNKISKPWVLNNEKYTWFSRSAWSMLAITMYCMTIKNKKSINILIPGYFCNESTIPLKKNNAKINYYPVHEDGSPDIDYCRKISKLNKPDIFLHVHYFGKYINVDNSLLFARDFDTLLVEDCAHMLLPNKQHGFKGDFIFFSPHKFLPIPDGAILLFNSHGPNKLDIDRFNFLESVGNNNIKYKNQSAPYYWLLKRVIQKLGISPINNNINSDVKSLKNKGYSISKPKMSNLAKIMLRNIIDGIYFEESERYQKIDIWRKYLIKKNIILNTEAIVLDIENPYQAVIQFNSQHSANKVKQLLSKFKIPVSTWPDLPDSLDKKIYREDINNHNTRLFLPIHSSISEEKIKNYFN